MASLSSLLNNPILVSTGPFIIIFLIACIWFRAGTIVSLLERVWRLAAGKAEISDSKLIKLNKELRDIEQFNFLYGFKIKSIGQMHQIIEWMEKHKLGFADIRSTKKWIDMRTMTIQLPSESYIKWRIAGFIFCALLLMLTSFPLGLKSALLQFKDSKTWILLDKHKAEGLISNWVLGVNQCDGSQESKSLIPELTKSEKEIICQSFQDKEVTEYVEKTLHTQRLLFGFIFVALVLSIMNIAMKIKSYELARKLQETLAKPNN
ncbi:hypothetical protein INP77_10360 [Methylophilus sp. 13]|uniref:DUF6216 family protein n=1 Tax=Methylophilus sp. 13 TaxID=2781018 RepID=UPI00188F4FF1|nr:DUF6216 family protein [Methylophilus sp. 13]MBF5039892.1 hypothetical protein [Methylophilus sp. 13]